MQKPKTKNTLKPKGNERRNEQNREVAHLHETYSKYQPLECLGVMILELWSPKFWDITTQKLSFHLSRLPSFPTTTLTILSSRVLFPISLSTWCSSKLNCSLEIIPGHFGGGGGGCDWPARVFTSLCNTSLLLTAQCIKPSTHTTQHISHYAQNDQAQFQITASSRLS